MWVYVCLCVSLFEKGERFIEVGKEKDMNQTLIDIGKEMKKI